MRTSQFLLATQKETPADAELVSHQLMLRAGMIRKLGAGLYTWLPLGWRVLKKVEAIVREEMQATGALECLMPAIQPAELWQETQRWDAFGDQLLKIKDRGQRDYCFGPTHEEVITDIMRHELKSYKQLPINLFQIQTKFRDEIRPRFGVMRAREFLMKDAYSFHTSKASLNETYQQMYQAYCRIFERTGLHYRAVLADTGSIGGSQSHEFQVLADSGEDSIFYSDSSDYAANVELAEAVAVDSPSMDNKPLPLTTQQGETSPLPTNQTVSLYFVHGNEDQWVALALRADHELNLHKLEKLSSIPKPVRFVNPQAIEERLGCQTQYLGPVELNLPIIVDRSVAVMRNFACGANQQDQFHQQVNWERDAAFQEIADLRNVHVGDPSPDGHGKLQYCRGIEVGHIFQLGDKYSQAMGATVLNEQGKATHLHMGCYGIGVSRIVAAAIEQHHDQQGIVWPAAIAPFQVVIVPINFHQSPQVRHRAQAIYQQLQQAGYEVLLDDRNERPGVMFNEMDLIGIPYRLVISDKHLANQQVEYKKRDDTKVHYLSEDNVLRFIQSQLPK